MHHTHVRPIVRLALAALLTLAAPLAHAQNTLRVPSAYARVQDAIVAAADGDTVVVSPGTYVENIDFKGKAITVTSDAANGGNAQNTILDGGGGALPTVQFVTNEGRHSILQGFTVQNGGGTKQPSVDSSNSGGIFLSGTSPSILENVITRNVCYGVQGQSASPLIQANQINGTTYTSASPCLSSAGAGISILGSQGGSIGPPIVANNIIEDNVSAGLSGSPAEGAGVSINNSIGIVVVGNVIRNNISAAGGGGIGVATSGSFYIFDNVIARNQAGASAAISVSNSLISTGVPNAVISNNTIVDNITTGSRNAGAFDDAQVLVNGFYSRLVVANNIISGSSASPAFAHEAGIGCRLIGGLSVTPVVIDNNDIYNALGPSFAGEPACAAQARQFGNLSVDPQFVNTAGGDYHLRPGSPLIDTGNTSVLTDLFANGLPAFPDLDGSPRVVDATGLGYPVIDLGVYETQGAIDAVINALFLTANAYQLAGGSSANLTAALFTAGTGASGTVTLTQTNPDGTTQPYNSPIITRPPAPPADPGGLDASFTTAPLAPGLYSFVATYPAPAGGSPATSVHVYILVDAYATTLTLTSSVNPSNAGQAVTFTVQLGSTNGGVPPGSLTLLIDNVQVTTLQPDATGRATYTLSSLTPGTHAVQVQYAGTRQFQPASAILTQNVNAGLTTATTLTANPPAAAAINQPVTFSVHVANSTSGSALIPAGTVQIYEAATPLSAPQTLNAAGDTTFPPITTLTLGTHQITATYTPAPGPPTFSTSSGTLSYTITGEASTTTLAAQPNPAFALASVTLSATVQGTANSGPPTGTVTFFDGTAVLGTANVAGNGQATLANLQFTAAAQGTPLTHPLHAMYSGTAALSGSTSATVNEVINPNPTATAVFVPPTGTAFAPITLASHTTSGTTGTRIFTPVCNPLPCVQPSVTFFSGGNALGTVPVDATGGATLTLTPSAGLYSITAVFSGDGIFAPSTSPAATLTVAPIATALSLTAAPPTVVVRQSTTLTAALAVAGAPPAALTGTVTFSDGGTLIGTAPLTNGVASISYAPQTAGAHSILAHFSGSGSLLAADATLTLNVAPQDFTLTPRDPAVTLKTEHHTTTAITVATLGGLADTIQLRCENLPSFTTCQFRPGDIGVQGDTSSTSVALYLDTDFVLGYASLRPSAAPPSGLRSAAPIALALLFPAALLFGLRRRVRLPRLLLIALLSAGALSTTGCSGLYPPHTPPGTYTVTITGHAAKNNITRTTTLTLVVTP